MTWFITVSVQFEDTLRHVDIAEELAQSVASLLLHQDINVTVTNGHVDDEESLS